MQGVLQSGINIDEHQQSSISLLNPNILKYLPQMPSQLQNLIISAWEESGRKKVIFMNLIMMKICIVTDPEVFKYILVTLENKLRDGEFEISKAPNAGIFREFLGDYSLPVQDSGTIHNDTRALSLQFYKQQNLRDIGEKIFKPSVERTLQGITELPEGEDVDLMEVLTRATLEGIFGFVINDPNFHLSYDEMLQMPKTLQGGASFLFKRTVFGEFLTKGIQHNYEEKVLVETDRILDRVIEFALAKRKDIDVDANPPLDYSSYLADWYWSQPEDKREHSYTIFRDQILTTFIAGHETSTKVLGSALYHLSKKPEEIEKIRNALEAKFAGREIDIKEIHEIPELINAVTEAMRMIPPAPSVQRVVTADIELGDVVIPAGTVIFLNFYGTSHDPVDFPEPDDYKPGRYTDGKDATQLLREFKLLPFAAGPRGCIGDRLAMMTIPYILGCILRKFDYKIDGEFKLKTGAPENIHGITPPLMASFSERVLMDTVVEG